MPDDSNASDESLSLAHEAKLLALLNQNINEDGSPSTNGSDCSGIHPESAIEVLLCEPRYNQLILRSSEDGQDILTCYRRFKLIPGQQRVSWHVPISPAMPNYPNCHAEIDASEGRVRFTNVQKFGVRAELTMPRSVDKEIDVLVTISIVCSKTSR